MKKYIYTGLLISFIALFQIPVASAVAPSSPSNLRAISGNEKVYLTWEHSSSMNDLLGYKLYMKEDDNDLRFLVGLPGTPPPNYYVVSNLDNGVEYYFALTSYNEVLEESDMIESQTIIPADTSFTDSLPPENISNIALKPGNKKVSLSWDHSLDTQNDLVGYKIYVSENDGDYKPAINVGYVNSYTVDNLINGRKYKFKITSFDEVPNENTGFVSGEAIPSDSYSDNTGQGIELDGDLPSTNTFIDVNSDNVFKSYIEFLAARNIIKGYADRKFMPNKKLSRGEATKIILVATGTTELNPVLETSFSDLSPQNPLASFIEEAYFYNIVSGYNDGTFRPDQPIFRKEFAKIFMEATQGTLSNPVSKPYFIDVSLDYPFSKWIYSAYKKGYINGYEDSTFRPDFEITRAEASKIVATYLQGESNQLPQNSSLELNLLSLINSARIDRGLGTITIDQESSIVARNHAVDLAENIKSPSSVSSDGSSLFDRLQDAGISYNEASENVAKVSVENRTDFGAVNILFSAIMSLSDNQQNQKANILSTYKNFHTIGIGIKEDEESKNLYIVMDFIS